MVFPTLPDTVYKLFIVVGIGAVLAAIVQPTDYYEQWQDARADRDKQAAILEIERNYLAELEERIRSRDPTDEEVESLMRRKKELKIQAAELAWLRTRTENLRSRWKKANLWGYIAGLGGLMAIFSGTIIWWRRDS
jgi:hypothetical protein